MQLKYIAENKPLRFTSAENAGIDVPIQHLEIIHTLAIDNLQKIHALIHTGIRIELPQATYAILKLRSGTFKKLSQHYLAVTTDPGIIDNGYRGELLFYLSLLDFYNPKPIDKIIELLQDYPLQIVIATQVYISPNNIQNVQTIKPSQRQTNAFGSTEQNLKP
jgi:dUTPase